jgi:hypothetical protein
MSEFFEEKFDEEPEASLVEEEDLEEPEDALSDDALNLLQLGELRSEFDYFGNLIEMRTLQIGEELEIGVLTKSYSETVEGGRAYTTAVVAASVDTIDGKPIVRSLGADQRGVLKKKFDYFRRFYWPTIKDLNEHYKDLLRRQAEALEELEKKSSRALSTSSDFSES